MQNLIDAIAEAIHAVDRCGVPFKKFRCGVGPYGEPQLVKLIANHLRTHYPESFANAKTCRSPDLLIPGNWALEVKIVRPFGDNDKEAEHWSQNLLHPYAGNVSAIGDALKLKQYIGQERRGIVVISYQHTNPKIDLELLVQAYELLCKTLLKLPLSKRFSAVVPDCVHPVHQTALIHGWELERRE